MDTVLQQPAKPLKNGNRLDILRVLLTMGIVFRHATSENLQPVVWVTEVCVPLFFVMSGYLFFWNTPDKPSGRWFRDKIQSRFFTLLIPYLIANIIAWLCYFFAIREVPSMVSGFLGDNWKNPLFVFWTGPINLSLWFIRELILLVLLSPLIYFLLRYTRWFGVLVLGGLWLYGIGPSPLFYFSTGGCLGMYKISVVEDWLHRPARITLRSRAWTFFIYLYHYLLLIGVKKGLAMLIPFTGIWADVTVWFLSVVIVLAALSAAYALGRRFVPRITGILVGGK